MIVVDGPHAGERGRVRFVARTGRVVVFLDSRISVSTSTAHVARVREDGMERGAPAA